MRTMSTPLDPPVNPSSRKNRHQEINRLLDQFDQATGRKSRGQKPQPWHDESKLSKKTKEALDALEHKEQRSGGFYKETPEQKAKQDAFDKAVKDIPATGAGTWKAGPVSKRDRLLAWHKALGTPSHVVEQELKALEQQESLH